MSAEENGAPAGVDGLEQDVFHWQGGAVADIELATGLDVAAIDPVGGSIAGDAETSRVAEGLQGHGTPPEAVAPVLQQTPDNQVEQLGGQARQAEPWRDSHTHLMLGTVPLPSITALTRRLFSQSLKFTDPEGGMPPGPLRSLSVGIVAAREP